MRSLLSDATVLELVERIYAAGSDPSQWQSVVARVHREVPGAAFGILLSIEATGILGNSANAGYDPESVKSFLAHYQHINPYEALFRGVPVGKVLKATNLTTRDWLESHAFYHEWLKPAGDSPTVRA